MRNKIRTLSTVLLCIFVYTSSLEAQDNNYWNIQYGTRSTLLGGTVIGSVSDLSATYYNPGAIALFPDIKFILSAQVYQLDNYKIKDGAGKGKDLDYSSLIPSPNFVAFNIKFDFLGDDRLAISVLTRQNINFEFVSRIIDSVDVIQSSPGKVAGGIDLSKQFDDIWGGITYATKFNKVIGLGFTGYLAFANLKSSNEVILQAFEEQTGDIASFTDIQNYRFNNLRTLLKAGVGVNLSPLTMGLSVTTPSLNILGTGSAGTHLFVSGLDTSRFQSNYQDEIKSEYKSSWSVGFGAAYKFEKIKLHFSCEWFDAVNKFFVLDTEPYLSQSSGVELTNDLTNESKSVINYGLGIDYFAGDSLSFSASFITDFSAGVENTQTNLAPYSGSNLYHIAGGVSFIVWKTDLTLGLVYTFGSHTVENNIALTPEADGDISQESELAYSQIKVLLGFEL